MTSTGMRELEEHEKNRKMRERMKKSSYREGKHHVHVCVYYYIKIRYQEERKEKNFK